MSAGPVLTLSDIPDDLEAVLLEVRHTPSGRSMALVIPANHPYGDLTLDFADETILDESGADRSALLSASDRSLWIPEPLITGIQELTIEATGPILAYSNFTTESGAMTGDSLGVGGTWTGAGDSDDFTVAAGVATRNAVSDTSGVHTGRFAIASGPTFTGTDVRFDLKRSAAANCSGRAIARYSDVNNFVEAEIALLNGPNVTVEVYKRASSTNALIGPTLTTDVPSANDTWYSARFVVEDDGEFAVWVVPQGEPWGEPVIAGQDNALATAGALASGKAGIQDIQVGGTANTRSYDNFSASAPGTDYGAIATLTFDEAHW